MNARHIETARTLTARFGFAIIALALPACAEAYAATPPAATTQSAQASAASSTSMDPIDAKLVQSLPGFTNEYATVNGVRLHYVIGGTGAPLFLLPGWPETWWEFHKVMPTLAANYRVIAVDLRGMGGSDRPASGYDKKTMAKDIHELAQHLKLGRVHLAGHDIGSAVAYSFAANYPDAVGKVVLMDVPPPDKTLMAVPLLPAAGTFGDKLDPAHAYPWWFAFHQVKGLPEQILAGRIKLEQDWMFRYLLVDDSAISSQDRAVYEAAYNSADAIRAGNAWYQTFPQDVLDTESYKKLDMPVLGLGGHGYFWMQAVLPLHATNARVIHVEKCGHFVPEEQPDFTSKTMIDFLGHG